MRFLRHLRDWGLYTAFPLWLFFTFILTFGSVDGNSMEPTLGNGERVVVYKLSHWLVLWGWSDGLPEYGDIVVLHPPLSSPYSQNKDWLGQREYMVKRVVGKPLDTIQYQEGKLYRNGVMVSETYTSSVNGMDSHETVTLGKDEYYVLGDNRTLGSSLDSREFGAVALSDMVGKLLWHF